MRYPAAAARGARVPTGLPALAALVLLGACGPGVPGPGGAPGPAEACLAAPAAEVAGGAASPVRSSPLEIGLAGPIDPGAAPVPRHPDEAFLFRLLYEPLVRLDCRGRAYPALATSWSSDAEGRRWSFELREEARFWDGRPVTATDVVASWSAAERAGRTPWGGAPPVSVTVEDELRITVRFPEARGDAPGLFARPSLAVVRPSEDPRWPVTGTGPYRIAEAPSALPGSVAADPAAGRATISLVSVGSAAEAAGLPSRVRIRVARTGDLRDLLDLGVDLVVTADPATLDYARLRSGLSSRPLPWSRTYVLATRRGETEGPPRAFLDALAREAVREEARAAESSGRPAGGVRCVDLDSRPSFAGRGAAGAGGVAGPAEIAYVRGDAVARGLAARLVALGSAAGGGADPGVDRALRALGFERPSAGLVAAAVGPEELPAELRPESGRPGGAPGAGGTDGAAEDREPAYVVGPAPPLPAGGCTGGANAEEGRGWRIVPLIETRRTIVHRPLSTALAVDADGTVHFHGPERR